MDTTPISFGGLFSGLDTESIIEQLMYIERAPVRLIEQQQTKLGYEKEELQTVNNSLLSLKEKIKTFVNGVAFENKVSSADEAIVTGTANAAANAGSHTVSIEKLAQEQIMQSGTKASGYTLGGAGSFDITYDNGSGANVVFNVAYAGGETLGQLAGLINNSTGGGGEDFRDFGEAYLIQDPVSGDQTLLIKDANTGEEKELLDITHNAGTDVLGAGETGLNTGALDIIQAAQNAEAIVDGVTVYSETNTFSNAITGVTLQANSADPGNAVDVTVGLADDDFVQLVTDFVDQFNSSTDLLATYIKEKPLSDPETDEDLRVGILNGDYDLQSAKSEIRMRTTGYIDSSLTDYQLLSQIGITSEASVGSSVSDNIELDEQKLRDALADDKAQVTDLLEGWADQLDTYLEAQTEVSIIETDAGTFYGRILSIEDRIEDLDDDIDTWEERLESIEETMRNEWIAMESALAQLQSQSDYLSQQLSALTSSLSKSK